MPMSWMIGRDGKNPGYRGEEEYLYWYTGLSNPKHGKIKNK